MRTKQRLRERVQRRVLSAQEETGHGVSELDIVRVTEPVRLEDAEFLR